MMKFFGIVIVACFGFVAQAAAAAPATRPNVLFIISDDLNTQALSCYGSTVSNASA
jgi:hypothetical protein